MSGHEILGADRFTVQPWRNGLGATTELLALRTEGSFLWRVSMAPVTADGPFSDFSGYDRILVLLEGRCLQLRFDTGAEVVLDSPYAQARFSGDWVTEGRVPLGPIRDFNVMTRRDCFTASVELLRSGVCPASDALDLLYAPEAEVALADAGGSYQLPAGALFRRGSGLGPLTVSGTALWVRITAVVSG